MKRIAFFDVDKTIFDGYLAPDILQYLEENDVVQKGHFAAYRQAVEKYKKGSMDYNGLVRSALRSFARSITGKPREEVDIHIRDYFDQSAGIFPWVESVMEFLKDKSVTINLVSGAPNPAVNMITQYVGGDTYLSTELKEKDGVFTGGVGTILDDEGKKQKIMHLIKEYPDIETFGFGDSPGDISMLNLTDHAFVISNPHMPQMRKIAQQYSFVFIEDPYVLIDYLKEIIT